MPSGATSSAIGRLLCHIVVVADRILRGRGVMVGKGDRAVRPTVMMLLVDIPTAQGNVPLDEYVV